MKIKPIVLLLFLFCGTIHTATAQYYGVRVNALALATGTLNGGLEIMLSDKSSIEMTAYWNPVHTGRLKMQLLAVRPGIRYWWYETYAGHFFGFNLLAASYCVGNAERSFNGWLTGFGVSWGYAWILSKQWNLSAEAGVGCFYMRDKRRYHRIGLFDNENVSRYRRWALAPSKCEITFTYLF